MASIDTKTLPVLPVARTRLDRALPVGVSLATVLEADDVEVRSLACAAAPLDPDENAVRVLDRLVQDASEPALPVVLAGRPLGILNRARLIEVFGRAYARELHSRDPISAFMNPRPVIVDASASIDDVARMILAGGLEQLADGFIVTEGGRYLGLGSVQQLLEDITSRKEARLYHLAHYDQLTGLPNRLLFMDRLQQGCAQAERNGEVLGLLFIDLDRFKRINDTLGHAVGDAVIREVAQRIVGALRETDTVARLSGDEFAAILTRIDRREDAALVAEKIMHVLRDPLRVEGYELTVGASIGIAESPGDAVQAEELLKLADIAMYEAKSASRNTYRFYSDEMNRTVSARLFLEQDLRRALAEEIGLWLAYQPIVDTSTGSLCAVECLLRWDHPERGAIPPTEIIPVAEDSGLIVPLGRWVLGAA